MGASIAQVAVGLAVVDLFGYGFITAVSSAVSIRKQINVGLPEYRQAFELF